MLTKSALFAAFLPFIPGDGAPNAYSARPADLPDFGGSGIGRKGYTVDEFTRRRLEAIETQIIPGLEAGLETLAADDHEMREYVEWVLRKNRTLQRVLCVGEPEQADSGGTASGSRPSSRGGQLRHLRVVSAVQPVLPVLLGVL